MPIGIHLENIDVLVVLDAVAVNIMISKAKKKENYNRLSEFVVVVLDVVAVNIIS